MAKRFKGRRRYSGRYSTLQLIIAVLTILIVVVFLLQLLAARF